MAENRDDLIEAVWSGRILPQDAEVEAKRLGLGHLSFHPPADEHDPMRETFWTPIMAVAWIVWRTQEAVREAWPVYADQCWVWRYRKWRSPNAETTYEGYELARAEPPSLLTLLHVDAYPDPFGRAPRTKHVQLTDARDELLAALRMDRIQATGIPIAGGEPRRKIQAFEWADLIFNHIADDDRFTHNRELKGHGYRHVLVTRDQILGLWKPALPPTPSELPAVVSPQGTGFMTVFHALLWIATSGGAEQFAPDDREQWQKAFDTLLPVLASGHVELTGEAHRERTVIPPYVVAACGFAPPFSTIPAALLHGTGFYLRSCPYIDDEHWRGGADDALVVGVQERWTRLMVPQEAIIRAWPFGHDMPTMTGAPGRPTSMPLVHAEFVRRRDAGLLASTLKKEASVLREWFLTTHKKSPAPTEKTIQNRIRSEFKAAR